MAGEQAEMSRSAIQMYLSDMAVREAEAIEILCEQILTSGRTDVGIVVERHADMAGWRMTATPVVGVDGIVFDDGR